MKNKFDEAQMESFDYSVRKQPLTVRQSNNNPHISDFDSHFFRSSKSTSVNKFVADQDKFIPRDHNNFRVPTNSPNQTQLIS